MPTDSTTVRKQPVARVEQHDAELLDGRRPNCGTRYAARSSRRVNCARRVARPAGQRAPAQLDGREHLRAACVGPTPGTRSNCRQAGTRQAVARRPHVASTALASVQRVRLATTRARAPWRAARCRRARRRQRAPASRAADRAARRPSSPFRVPDRVQITRRIRATRRRVPYTGADAPRRRATRVLTASRSSLPPRLCRAAQQGDAPGAGRDRSRARRGRRALRRRGIAAAVEALSARRRRPPSATTARRSTMRSTAASAPRAPPARPRAERVPGAQRSRTPARRSHHARSQRATGRARRRAGRPRSPDDASRRREIRSRLSRRPCKKRARRSGVRTTSPPRRPSRVARTQCVPRSPALMRRSPPRRPVQHAAADKRRHASPPNGSATATAARDTSRVRRFCRCTPGAAGCRLLAAGASGLRAREACGLPPAARSAAPMTRRAAARPASPPRRSGRSRRGRARGRSASSR